MARYVHPNVRDRAQDPDESRIQLAVVPSEGETETLREAICQYDTEIVRELPSGILIVEVPSENLTNLFDVEGIESISPTESMETLA